MKKQTPYQIVVHILGWMPLAVLIAAYFTDNLTVNPIQTASQRTGDIAIIMLLLSLACTPLNTIFGWSQLLKLRRPLGLYAFFYASLHLLIYTGWDYGFNFQQASATLSEKRYLIAGLGGLILLIPLAFTSSKKWMKRLGTAWKKLHRLVYLAAGLVVLHLAWVIKGNVTRLTGDIWKPLAAGLFLTIFLLVRIPGVRKIFVKLRRRKAPVRKVPVNQRPEPVKETRLNSV